MNAEAYDERKPVDVKKYYTYEDYLNFPEGIHVELIDGVPYPLYGSEPLYDFTDPVYMEGPGQRHQEISGELFFQFYTFFKRKVCKVFHAPFDVRFNPEKKKGNIFEPDILVVCDKDQLNGKYCLGAPDFVLEIASPSTYNKDMTRKIVKYMNEGVRELWFIVPDEKVVHTYVLTDEKYYTMAYINPREIPVSIFDGLTIDFTEIFPPGSEDEDEEQPQESAGNH
jgi:Uma2 family endonuclease